MEILNVKTGLFGKVKEHPLGQYPLLSTKVSEKVNLTYIAGEEIIDNLFEKCEFYSDHQPKTTRIINHPDGLEFITSTFMDEGQLLILRGSNISSWSIQENSNTIKKSKSVLGRSVAGALIAGPIGGVIGGISGLGETTLNYDYLFNIHYKISDNVKNVIFGCKSSKVKKLLEIMQTEYSKLENVEVEEAQDNSSMSINSKIEKYTDLLDKGLITEEEFLKLKKTLFD